MTSVAPTRGPRILAAAEHNGTRYVLEDRGGVYVVGEAWGLGKVCRSEGEAWVRFHEASGGVALEATGEETNYMNPVDRFIARVGMGVEAEEHLEHAIEACEKAKRQVERGFYLAASLAATDVEDEAARARRLLMRAYGQEVEDTTPEPTEEEKAEIEEEMARILASEDQLEACEAAAEHLDQTGEDEDALDVYLQLRNAIAKARPL